jgi:Domain of unknown function (DUF5666)
MSRHVRSLRRYALLLLLLPLVLPVLACGDGDGSPTSPGAATATLAGTLVRGTSVENFAPRSEPIGLVGVTVRVAGGSASTVTDGAGRFTLTGLAGGEVELEFERGDIHARGRIALAAGARTTVTIAIVGNGIQTSPRGHAGEEIEGLVQAIDAGAGELTVLDQRLGAVSVLTDGATLIRRGDTTIPLYEIEVGNRVHVKALEQDDGTYLATQILLQGDRVGGSRSFSGSVLSIDAGDASFVVSSSAADITVETNGSTRFHRRGGQASFSDLAVGSSVEVRGTLQEDGSVLASKVTIES